MRQIKFTEIEGIKVGHAQDLEAVTGCTVIISEEGATVGVDVRGGAPGTRETDLLNPVNLVQKVHAIVLTGGSAFGLDAAAGVMQYLEEKNVGFDVQVTKVPIVCGAALFDLTTRRMLDIKAIDAIVPATGDPIPLNLNYDTTGFSNYKMELYVWSGLGTMRPYAPKLELTK